MKYRILTQTEKELFGADAMAILDYTDVAALGANLTGNLAVCPATTAGAMPTVGTSGTDALLATHAFKMEYLIVDTAFVSSTAAGLAFTVGDSGSATRFLASTQVQSGQTPVTGAVGITNKYFPGATNVVNAYFTATTANLSTFTAGSMRLFFHIDDLAQLPKT